MDFRKLLGFLWLLIFPGLLAAQTTAVTGTVIDPNGNAYANGTASAVQVVASGQNPGTPTNTTTSSVGSFSMTLASPASYVFTICAAPTQIGPVGNPTPKQVCFQSGPISVSGTNQSVSAALSAISVVLGPNFTTVTAVGLQGPGNIVGTFGGSPTMTGSWTFSNVLAASISGLAGTATALAATPTQCGTTNVATGVAANGNANCTATAAIKYSSASAYRYVDGAGNDSNDGLSPGTAFATPQHCLSVVVGLGGGTCDARTLYSLTYSTEIDVGQHSPAIAVTLLVPPTGTWTCNVTGGTSNCLKVFNFGSAIGATSGQGNPFIIQASATASVVDVCGTEPSPAVGGSYIHMEGFGCASVSGAAVSGAVAEIQALFDISRISDIATGASSASTKALWIHGVCCGALVERMKGNGNLTTGNVPCTFGKSTDSNSGSEIGPISCTGAGSGLNQVAIVQSNIGSAPAHYHDVYTEADLASDTTSTVVGVTGTSGLADVIDRLTLGADQAGSTRYMVDIANGSSVVIHSIQLGGISVNGINDHNTGRGTLSPGASSVITDYSVQLCCGASTYLVHPQFISSTSDPTGTAGLANYRSDLARMRYFDTSWHSLIGADTVDTLTNKTPNVPLNNGTALQFFNTTTSCTTAASAGATCTTANISLPVSEPDTSYRISCAGKGGGSGVAVVQSIINVSSSQFTITIAALTASAATFPSYDCIVGHN